jgi:hypothetical protein
MTIAQAPKKGKELHNYQDREKKKDRTKLTAFVSEPQAIYPSAMDSPMKFCNKKKQQTYSECSNRILHLELATSCLLNFFICIE